MFVISVSIIILHVVLIYWVRGKLRNIIKNEDIFDFILDGLFAFELGCLAQEQGVILQYYGILSWCCCLFAVIVWQMVGWPGYSSSPIPNLLKFNLWGVVKTGFMLIASLASYRYMSMIWRFEMTELHRDRSTFTSLDRCVYPFDTSSLWLLAATEFIGSLVLSLFSIFLNRNQFLINNDHNFAIRGVITALAVVLVVLLGMDISGAMYNPTLATLLLGGCKGQGNIEHILVYWCAPTLGAWLAPKMAPEMAPKMAPKMAPEMAPKIVPNHQQSKKQQKLKSN